MFCNLLFVCINKKRTLIGWAVKFLVTYLCALSKKQYLTMTGNETGLSPRAMGRGFPPATFMGSMKKNRAKSNSWICHSCWITHPPTIIEWTWKPDSPGEKKHVLLEHLVASEFFFISVTYRASTMFKRSFFTFFFLDLQAHCTLFYPTWLNMSTVLEQWY